MGEEHIDVLGRELAATEAAAHHHVNARIDLSARLRFGKQGRGEGWI